MQLVEDKAQKIDQHEIKNKWWKSQGIEVVRYPLPVGDYILADDKVRELISRKQKRNVEIKKMDFVGTYKVCVDTKKDIQELIGDICGKQHERFRDECMFAQNNGIKLYILVENTSIVINERKGIYSPFIDSLDNLHRFVNPRLFIWRKGKQLYPTATKGITLKKACITMTHKYGVEFMFCRPNEAAEKVIELLAMGNNIEDSMDIKEKKYGRVISSGSE
jgi:ribosome-associated protein